MEGGGKKALADAVEKTLVINELKGKETIGYYYTVTDRASPRGPGDYKYMTQGQVAVGDLLAFFSIFSQNKAAPEHAAALQVLQNASQKIAR